MAELYVFYKRFEKVTRLVTRNDFKECRLLAAPESHTKDTIKEIENKQTCRERKGSE